MEQAKTHDWKLLLSMTVLTVIGVAAISKYALLCVLLDGAVACAIVGSGMLGGVAIVGRLKMGPMPLRWHLLLGAALGLGCLSLAVLGLGLVGWLAQPILIVLLAGACVAGYATLRARAAKQTEPCDAERTPNAWRAIWFVAIPFLVLALVAAANAPGLIWSEEGFGYDVLEYHLQLPKEYYEAGRIAYLPHNVYANFPANVEMLYLLGMVVTDNVADIGVTANVIHLLLGVLAVFAAWVAGREWSPRAGVVCGVVAASTGWFTYLSGLAYVENGMLFFGMTAMAVLIRVTTLTDRSVWRWVLISGICAGFACGCKYTAVPMIAAPLVVAPMFFKGWPVTVRIRVVALLALTATLALSPWLGKNYVITGNPVFPLANTFFDASPTGWGDEQTAQWNESHRVAPELRNVRSRISAMWPRVIGDRYQRFGPMLLLLPLVGLLGRRRERMDWLLVAIFLVQVGVWVFATHLFARFAVVFIIPLVLLAGRSLTGMVSLRREFAVLAVVIVGAGWNLVFAARLHRAEAFTPAPASVIYDGSLPSYAYFRTINTELPQDAKILLVGESRPFYFQRVVDYCVVFNNNPFVTAVRNAEGDQQIVMWLHEQGYTHVLVNWSEIRRLRRSRYGFADEITPELFGRLEPHGLRTARSFELPGMKGRYVTLYEISQQ